MTAASQLDAARAAALFAQAGVPLLSPDQIDVADFGLGDLEHVGAAIVVHINTDRYCAKEIAAFPQQTIPQHCHPPIGSDPGKEETFFCRWGMIWLYVEGEPASQPQARVLAGSEAYCTVSMRSRCVRASSILLLRTRSTAFRRGMRAPSSRSSPAPPATHTMSSPIRACGGCRRPTSTVKLRANPSRRPEHRLLSGARTCSR